ncbi:hypothetical protein EAI80_12690 [Catenibacterium sp. co_0103]|uniref:DUF6718 family protein n=1 Tax=unclassified Catenibacterium TaxID=2643636 RepID=UPI001021C1D2|nr:MULTISPECIES: DUF6718 family protein [unclassified Catenibacterium]MEE0820332.1 DUF6718 family protein [Catenibacterium sp.]MZT13486.1 hypothetical protein [Catenibacterium sp. BIOML-A1]RYT36859.1 hypothetical protein EAI80_12690 [Catenibacterium sp. co_0103]
MCYLIAKRMNKTGCVALQTEPGEEMAKFADEIQERLGYDIEIITISRPTAYGKYEPYHFVNSYEEFEKEASLL